jgi:hypothetical protein
MSLFGKQKGSWYDPARLPATLDELFAAPLPELGETLLLTFFGPGTQGEQTGGNLLDGDVVEVVRDHLANPGPEKDPSLKRVVLEAIQMLENGALLCPIQYWAPAQQSFSRGWFLTRAGREAIDRGCVREVLER